MLRFHISHGLFQYLMTCTFVVPTLPDVIVIARICRTQCVAINGASIENGNINVRLSSAEKQLSHVFSFRQCHPTLDWEVAHDIPHSPLHEAIPPSHSTSSYDHCDFIL